MNPEKALKYVSDSGVASRNRLVVLSAIYIGMGGASHSYGRGSGI